MTLSVGFGHHGEFLPLAGTRCLKGKAEDTLHADAREDGDISCNGVRSMAMCGAAMSGIFAFAVLTDYHPVQVANFAVGER